MKSQITIIKYAALIIAAFSFLSAQNNLIKFGSDILLDEKIDLLKEKRIGVVTNKSATLADGGSLIDTLLENPSLNVKAFFALEHGIDLREEAGRNVRGTSINEVVVHSLYGENKKPTPAMLSGLDLILFDIQDIGTRCFTYISSLYYIIEACGENDVQLIVLDRPNPLGGIYVDGPILKDEFQSFVGITNLPFVHGMTIGELAKLFNDRVSRATNLTVIKMEGWQRDSYWDNYDIKWVNPSPNMINFETALVYPVTVFFEGTNISEGRGTYTPFEIFGAPFFENKKLKKEIDKLESTGIETRAIDFVPSPIYGKAESPKFNGEFCRGIQLKVVNKEVYKPVELAVKILEIVNNKYPKKIEINNFFNLLWGTDKIKNDLLGGVPADKIIAGWQEDLNRFKEIRINYLLY